MLNFRQMVSAEPYPIPPELPEGEPSGDGDSGPDWGRRLQKKTYLSLRRVMTYISILLPVVFLISAIWLGLQGSMSSFYYTIMQDVFVGSFFAIGICLLVYKGYNRLEDHGLTAAGILLFIVALVPTTAPEDSISTLPWYLPWIHIGCAYLSFGLIAVVCIWARKNVLVDSAKYNRAYNIIASLMILVLLAGVIFFLLEMIWEIEFETSTFWIEAAGIWIFAAYWRIKSRELKGLG